MATKTDAEGLVSLPYGELPDGDHLSRLWNLIADGAESLDDTSRAILYRVNDKTAGDVTYELIGRLAAFSQHVRREAENVLHNVSRIEGSLDDLATLAQGGEVDIAYFDEHGRKQHDWLERWQDAVSDALGIERFTGGYSKRNAEAITARLKGVDDA